MTDKLLGRLRDGELTLLVERGGRLVFASDRTGFHPVLRAVLEHLDVFEGSDVGLEAVGLATAYLFVHAKVARVVADMVTKEAERAFEEAGIAVVADQRLKQLKDSEAEDYDQIAREAGTVGRFMDELRNRLA